ncbi:MAG: transposase [Planctomycetaceae bacterium]|nr:transposase [Planctomycetaceae bacterium]
MEQFVTYQSEIIRFIENFGIPFDNNQAERDIRNTGVKMKISGGFRSKKSAETFAKLSSVVETAIKQGKSLIKTIATLFHEKIKT